MNVIVGLTMIDKKQPYASMQWRDAPGRSVIIALVIIACQIFAFYTVKEASKRKKEWEEFKIEVHQLSITKEEQRQTIDTVL